MPLIPLDEVSKYILAHQKYPLLCKDPKDVLPQMVHPLLNSLHVSALWQLLTFSGRELTMELTTILKLPHGEDTAILTTILDTLFPHGLAVRENAPFALRVDGKPPQYVKLLSHNTQTLVPEYADATYFWTRWEGFAAQNRLAPWKATRLVFRTEALKLGSPLRV